MFGLTSVFCLKNSRNLFSFGNQHDLQKIDSCMSIKSNLNLLHSEHGAIVNIDPRFSINTYETGKK